MEAELANIRSSLTGVRLAITCPNTFPGTMQEPGCLCTLTQPCTMTNMPTCDTKAAAALNVQAAVYGEKQAFT